MQICCLISMQRFKIMESMNAWQQICMETFQRPRL
jgi:hypothetical protein